MSDPNSLFWFDYYRQRLEAAEITSGLRFWSLGGPSFAVRSPKGTFYLDPYLGGVEDEGPESLYRTVMAPIHPDKVRLADAVLMSHDHLDHCHEPTIRAINQNTAARFVGPVSVAAKLRGFGIEEERIIQVAPGDRITIADATVSVWPGNDLGEEYAVCYVLSAGGVSAFYAGDSAMGEPTELVGGKVAPDVAMMAFGRTWYMDEAELLQAAAQLRCKLLLPYHWDIWYEHTGDPLMLGRLIERLQPEFAVELLLLGQSIQVTGEGRFERQG